MQVYTLSAFGERAARALRSHAAGEGGAYDPAVDVRRESSSRARREGDLLSYLFLTHHLAVSDLYVSLRALYEGPNPVIWRTGPSARVTFRSFLNSEGRSTVVPDALVGRSVDAAIGEPAEAVAVELDRGTMGLVAIEKKPLRYRELFAERGRRWPILFVVEDAARRRWLSGRLSDARLVGASLDREGSSLALVAWLEEGDRAFVAVPSPSATSQPT